MEGEHQIKNFKIAKLIKFIDREDGILSRPKAVGKFGEQCAWVHFTNWRQVDAIGVFIALSRFYWCESIGSMLLTWPPGPVCLVEAGDFIKNINLIRSARDSGTED